jgi:succinoglycan biosynthesis protein ExoA
MPEASAAEAKRMELPESEHSEREHVDISVLVPVFNEERSILQSVAAMQAQQFDGTVELLFADGRSEDRTREILEGLAERDPRIRVLDNPLRGIPSGLNVCLREARGEYVARMDAHTVYADGYLQAGVHRLRRGDSQWVSGPQIPRPVGAVSRAVALAIGSPLGRGGSRKWRDEEPGGEDSGEEWELDTGVFCGVWRRKRLLDIGGWDERWAVNEDSEMAARFLQRGERLICLAQMAGYYTPRDSLRSLARQYCRYGFYRARTFARYPSSARRAHLVPPVLALTLLAAALGPTRALRSRARLALAPYLLALLATGANAGTRSGRSADGLLLLAVLPAMHLGWGFGTLAGILRFGLPWPAITSSSRGALPASSQPGSAAGVYAPSLYARQ